jgi:hypothetical protein
MGMAATYAETVRLECESRIASTTFRHLFSIRLR